MEDGPPGFPRDSACPAVLRNLPSEPVRCRLRGYHPLWPALSRAVRLTCQLVTRRPCGQAGPTTPPCKHSGLGYVRVRSPLLAESRLISVPAGTEMVHFPALPSTGLWIQPGIPRHDPRWVTPFGDLRVEACLRLTGAFRSLPRPSSSSGAKAFTVRP